MIAHTHYIRVRYAETDQMGFLYYGYYAQFYEVARAEMIRQFGYTYKQMEQDGVVMPVVKMNCKYLKPAYYDDNIRIETTIEDVDRLPFLTFKHKLFNEQNELINKGEVTLIFVDPQTQQKSDMPEKMKAIMSEHFANA